MDAVEDKLAAADRGELPAEGGPIAPQVDPAAVAASIERQQWIVAVQTWGPALREFVPDYAREHWTDARLTAFGERLADVAKHYGWTFAGALGHPVAALFAAAFPLVWPIAAPHVMPMLKDQLGQKEKPVDQAGPVTGPQAPAAPPGPRRSTVAPVDG